MTLQEFSRIYMVLALQLRNANTDELAVAAYFDALQDMQIASVHDGAKYFARERGRKFFPTTAEWRDRAFLAFQNELRSAFQEVREKPWYSDCTACDDTGWEGFSCPERPCDRTRTHAPHVYVSACPCRATNRTYQRHHVLPA